MRLLALWVINALAVLLAAYIVPGIHVNGFGWALIVALVLGVMNVLIRPILLLLTLPINILTLGLFTFVINALVFWLAAGLVKGIEVTSFGAAFWGAAVIWAVSWITNVALQGDHQ